MKEFLRRHDTLFRYVPLVFWIGLIFFMSSGEASMAQTSRFIRPLLEFLFPNAPAATLDIYHGYIRKSAHFTEYGILALLAARVLRGRSAGLLRTHWFGFSLLLVLAVAALDEFNQSFNPARTGSPYDVLLDVFGGICALTALAVTAALRKRRRPEGADCVERPL